MRRVRSGCALVLALIALLVAISPWAWWPTADLVASALPGVPLLAVLAVLLDFRPRPATLLTAIAATGLAAFLLVPEWWLIPDATVPPGAQHIVLVTHNVGRTNVDPAGTVAALVRSDADIIVLQETNGTIAPYLDQLRHSFPYSNPCTNECSLAIFSKLPIDSARYRFRDDDGRPFGPGLVQTIVHLPGGGSFPIATVHLSRHLTPERTERIRHSLAAAISRVGPERLVLAGDFNLTPWSSAMQRLEQRLWPMQRGTRALFSFPARIDADTAPLPLVPIDHVFVGPGWTVASQRRLPRTGSDHYPVRVELIWR